MKVGYRKAWRSQGKPARPKPQRMGQVLEGRSLMTLSQSWNPLSLLILLEEGRKCEFCGWYFSPIASCTFPASLHICFHAFPTSSLSSAIPPPFTWSTFTPSPCIPSPHHHTCLPHHLMYLSLITFVPAPLTSNTFISSSCVLSCHHLTYLP